MQFDVVIIGGGLSGLTCGIRLAESGKRCAIVSTGQSALSFSSGSFDLLNQLPDGTAVDAPLKALSALAEQAPQHPYAVLGEERVALLAQESAALLQRSGIIFKGSAQGNHQRVTALGSHRPTWLSLVEIPTFERGITLPWKNIAIIGIEGFLDFQPELAATALIKQGVNVITANLHLPVLDKLRHNNSEFRSVNIARVLDMPINFNAIVEELALLTKSAEAIILPACLGSEDATIVEKLSESLGKPVMLLPTLPPSLLGIRIHQHLRRRFQFLGGLIMAGDTVLYAEVSKNQASQNQEIKVYSRNHVEIPLRAQQVVLASGSFFSNGLVAKFDRIEEPVFNLDLFFHEQRADWSQQNLFDAQPYLQFGVKTDNHFRALKAGQPLDNLYAVGAVLGGFDPLNQGCGAGVSLISALEVADTILKTTSAVKTKSALNVENPLSEKEAQ